MDFPEFLAEPLAGWLWRSSWQAAVLALLVLAIQGMAGRRLSAAWRYRLWLLVVLRLLLPVSVPSGLSVFNVAWLQPWPRAILTVAGSPASGIPSSITPPAALESELTTGPDARRLRLPADGRDLTAPVPELADRAGPETVGQSLGPSVHRDALADANARSAGAATSTTGRSKRAFGWMALWAAGVLVLGGRGLAQVWHFTRRLRREATPAGEREVRLFEECRRQLGVRSAVLLRETSLVSSPALFGLWQPTVLLPRALAVAFSDVEMRHVLLHELAHVRRRDLWVHGLVSMVRILHWFNPVLWLAFRRMQADRELATDALALSVAGEQEARSYGSTILKVLEGWSPAVRTVPGVGILEDRHRMRDRIRRIAAFRRPSRASAWAAVPMVALAAATLTDARSPRMGEAGAPTSAEAFTPVDLRAHLVTRWSAIKPGTSWQAVPEGKQGFGGVPFELTGLLGVAGTEKFDSDRDFPTRASGIRVGRRVAALHLLHGAGFVVPDGTAIARLILHYANGQSRELPIRYGEHVRHWWREPDEASEALADAQTRVAWTGTSPETDPRGVTLRLFHTRLTNPLPDQVLESIDLVSTLTRCSEVLVGLTTEAVGAAVPDVFAAAAGAVPAPGEGEFHPVPLERFCTRTYEVIDQDPDSSWAYAPHGRHVFNGVLFDLPGVMEVSGLGAARDDNPLPTSIREIPLGKAARRLHLLHGGAADLADGTPLAKLVLHYVDGRQHELRLVYGVNVRNWYKGGDKRDDVSDPNTRLGWTGDSPRSRRFGSTLRIYHTTFDLPWPEIELQSLDFVSLLSESVSVIPAITLETGTTAGAVAGVASTPPSTAAAPAPAPPSSEVRVLVLDDATGQPIPGATVRLRLADGRRNFRFGEQKATARGDLILDVLLEGPTHRTVEARAPGYLPADAVLNPGPLPDEVSIRLKAGTRVGGTVLDSRERPVSGAEVRIRRVTRDAAGQFVETRLDTVITDETGRWTTGTIPETPEGLSFVVSHVDHLPLEVEQASPAGNPGSAAPTATQLLAGQARFVLEDPPEISGRVFSARANQPLAAAEVVVATGPNFVNRRFTRTGADGRFRLAVPELGFARLVVQAPGFAPHLTSFEVERRTEAQEVRMAPARRLQGRVVDAAGQPVAKAWLYVGSWQGVNVLTWRTETDAEGRFAWEAAPRESFLLVADEAGHQQARQTINRAAADETVTQVTVTLTAGFTLEGAVFDADTRRHLPDR